MEVTLQPEAGGSNRRAATWQRTSLSRATIARLAGFLLGATITSGHERDGGGHAALSGRVAHESGRVAEAAGRR
ncbi:hypothetical protein ACPPVO_21975 [Dactylosporangium sp. McL0621]|uniref:hypothetical protein n=1 Tax=Dactylosporangium sp. McL0621 TaxID=3415678 RepID=UPI003CF612CC